MLVSCPEPILSAALRVLETKRVAVFIVAYNAEKHVAKVLGRIPPEVASRLAEVFIVDDSSKDATLQAASEAPWPAHYAPLRLFRTPSNQGYGGNQRLGYQYSIERGFDVVVLLHGDGQYAPEALPWILAPYAEGEEIVFGSRMMNKRDALKGGMPLYKWFGNQVLTGIQNRLLGMKLTEMHSGYRSYATSFLRRVPFGRNSLGFDFDADIIVQAKAAGTNVREVPIPTFYGDEVCHVDGMDYAWKCFKTALKFRLMRFEIFYDPKFDLGSPELRTSPERTAATGLGHFVRELSWVPGMRVLEVARTGGPEIGHFLDEKGLQVERSGKEGLSSLPARSFDAAVALHAIEHFPSSEEALRSLFRAIKPGGTLYLSAGNVAFVALRFLLLFGEFNYARRGLLDFGHKRLFTVKSLRRLLRDNGFRVERVVAFGPPIADLWLARGGKPPAWAAWLDRVCHRLAKRMPNLFGFHMLMLATRLEAAEDLLATTMKDGHASCVGES